MSSIASAQFAPEPITVSTVRGPCGRCFTWVSVAATVFSTSARHSSITRSSESVPSRVVYAGRDHTANVAIRSEAPASALTAAAARTSSSALSVPPKAAVTRWTLASPGQRNPRVARAIETCELCSSRSVTLPSEMWPNAPADDDPSTISRASFCAATSSRPAGADRALYRTYVAGTSPGR